MLVQNHVGKKIPIFDITIVKYFRFLPVVLYLSHGDIVLETWRYVYFVSPRDMIYSATASYTDWPNERYGYFLLNSLQTLDNAPGSVSVIR